VATIELIVPIQPRIGLLRTVGDNERAVRLLDERAIDDRHVKGSTQQEHGDSEDLMRYSRRRL
jgi:hypothetical protein